MGALTDDGHKSPIEHAVDLFFYAPLGLLLNAEEMIPQLVEKGRQQTTVARMAGRYALKQGRKQAEKAVARVQEQLPGARIITPEPARPRAVPEPAHSPPRVASNSGPPATSLAIPDYDSLSASQVVPRLDGLAAEELDAVRQYETANRGRQPILNKVARLQG